MRFTKKRAGAGCGGYVRLNDILDLRAGEPTAIFSADNVRRKVDELELGSLNITQPVTKNDEPANTP